MQLDSLVPFYFSATIGMNFLCAVVAFATAYNNRQQEFKALLLGCIAAIAYQYATWQYHEQSALTESVFWLKIQTSIMIATIPIYFLIFVQWSKQSISQKWLIFIFALGLSMSAYNLTTDSSIRYEDNIALISYQLFSGEQLYRTTGDTNPSSMVFALFAFCILGVLLWLAKNLLKQKQYIVATLLLTSLFLQLVGAILATLVDRGNLNFIYLGGLPFTVLNFMSCIWVSLSLGAQTRSLNAEIDSRLALEQALFGLSKGNANNSEHFNHEMLKELQRLTAAKCAYIGMLDIKEGIEFFTSEIFLVDGHQSENISYPLSIVPPELVTYDEMLVINKGLNNYTQFDLFKVVGAIGMINCPMTNNEGKLEGSVILIFDTEIHLNKSLLHAIEVFASRGAVEISRTRLETELHKMAYYDYQTKLPNLLFIRKELDTCFEAAASTDIQSVLLMIDLDKFAEVNRQYGFEMAEFALATVADRLSQYGEDDIIIARTGGDEFSVLLKNIQQDPKAYAQLQWDAISALIKKPIVSSLSTIKLQCSGGAVVFPEQSDKRIEVTRCAEIALGIAKHKRQHGLQHFDKTILIEMDRKAKLLVLLQQALIEGKELFPVFQPKVDANGKIIGAEALARWINTEIGFVSPVEFIEAAENGGLIVELGGWMIDAVCEQLNQWERTGCLFTGRIAINVSALQISEANFVSELISKLQSHHIAPSRIELELTESGLLGNVEDCIAKLSLLRDIGFTVALDDFGTGYSSLSYLKDLPLDVLKIDRSFVSDLDAQNTTELARSIVSIGHHMSLNIVAEGVEDLTQVNKLASMGCEIFQGYYFAKPMNAKDFSAWLSE